ncbi:hypothetical protein [Deinococcus sonorensis]|uniref:Methyltransferase type 11 domain-containing protein n=2 Tax=Deinococcus sonorensis TaxID=309891 RepID=A0AAU7UEN7_9DEIO
MRVIIGAGEQRWDGWTATQRDELDLTDPASFERYFGAGQADALLCEHVWEHLSVEQGWAAARLCFRFLRPGGRLRVAVPDGLHPDPAYQQVVQVGGPGPADHPAADHQVLYDHRSFVPLFEQAGFRVRRLEWWDEAGVLHTRRWAMQDGPVYRSVPLDHRNARYREGTGPAGFTSLILDALKPE